MKKEVLKKKWWYRLIKVFFVLFIFFGILISIFIGYTLAKFNVIQNIDNEIVNIDKSITIEQMNEILANAPEGADKRKLVDYLVVGGVDIEGINNKGIREKVLKEQQQKSLTEKSPILHFILNSLLGIFITTFIAVIIRYIFFYILTGKKKIL